MQCVRISKMLLLCFSLYGLQVLSMNFPLSLDLKANREILLPRKLEFLLFSIHLDFFSFNLGNTFLLQFSLNSTACLFLECLASNKQTTFSLLCT